MENRLSNYLGRELKNIIKSVQVYQGVAKGTGEPYYAIDLIFINGYNKRLFLKSDEQFAWLNAIDLMDAEHKVDNLAF